MLKEKIVRSRDRVVGFRFGLCAAGFYAVLGVAMTQAGNAVPISYLVAGVITLLTAHSYLKLTLHLASTGAYSPSSSTSSTARRWLRTSGGYSPSATSA